MESIKELNVYPEKGHSIMFVFRRKPGMSLEEFRYHYEFTHGPLATKLPGLISYRQHPTRKPGREMEPMSLTKHPMMLFRYTSSKMQP